MVVILSTMLLRLRSCLRINGFPGLWSGSSSLRKTLDHSGCSIHEGGCGLIQLLREWPPGFGGVERYAHELATELECLGESLTTVSLVPMGRDCAADPLPVAYSRAALWSVDIARLRIPIPQMLLLKLLWQPQPLLVHLPCPTVALLAWISLLLQPQRRVWVVWHAFLEGRSLGHRLYSQLLRSLLPRCAQITTTSPVLAASLARQLGCCPDRINVLPCVLPASTELPLLKLGQRRLSDRSQPTPYTLVCIGRLDSYKRIDWVLRAFAQSPAQHLEIVGDGPRRAELEQLTRELQFGPGQHVQFHGRLDEASKRAVLARAHVLVLASDSCHEAFGIVQLEAMAAAVPAISFDLPNSGMAWVNGVRIVPFLPMRREADLTEAIRYFASSAKQREAALLAQRRYQNIFARRHWIGQLERSLSSLRRASL